ncbi:MAG: TetR/AcrR family transcriptional regulator [Lachnospiraceae bacterium]|nr:TetR/AcrR family transcriptional regulator [Lachnospiraceae bacterium]
MWYGELQTKWSIICSEVIFMKREEKNALSKQRILDAAIEEFSKRGYDAASLNTLCAEHDISKGIIYHYFKDKDELYLLCAADCFDRLTVHLSAAKTNTADSPEMRLQRYFDARLHFFAENPLYLGIFLNAVLYPPTHLAAELARVREAFDRQNVLILTTLLESAPLRDGIATGEIVADFRMYMDYFNARFRTVLDNADSPKQALQEHEERCHRQLGILLHGVLEQ